MGKRLARDLAALAALATLLGACDSPPPPPTPPVITVAPPIIDWLAAGTPTIAAPSVPWLDAGTPITRTCPANWTQTGDRCEPWTGAAACAGAMMRVPGDAACRDISLACPSGDFASGLPAGSVYVLAGAPAGGDGSATLPFGTLAEALVAAPAGGTIALSRGTHAIDGDVALGVALRGACASATTLEATTGAQLLVTATASIDDVTIHPGDRDDPIYADGGTLQLQHVLLEGGSGYGITAHGAAAHVTLADVVVRNVRTRAHAASGATPYSAGLTAEVGGAIDGMRVAVEGASWIGASADAGSITLTDSILRGTHEDPALTDSAGTTCWGAGTVAFTRTLVEANVSRGVEVLAGCAGVMLTDVVVRGTSAGVSTLAYALVSQGPVQAQGLGLYDNAVSAIIADSTATGELDDLVVENVTADGEGVVSSNGATITVHRAVIRDLVHGLMPNTTGMLTAEDVLVEQARDIAVFANAGTLDVRRVVVRDVHTGLLSAGTNGHLTGSDVIVERVGGVGVADSDGLSARAGATLDVERVIVRDAMGGAVTAVQPGAIATVRDLVIERGSLAMDTIDGTIDVTRADVSASGSGAAAHTVASTLRLTDVRFHDLGPVSVAMGAQDGAMLELSRVLVERAQYGLVSEVTSQDQTAATVMGADLVLRELTAHGVEIAAGTVALTRISIDGAAETGIAAHGPVAIVHLADVAVTHMVGRADGHLGRGLHASQGAVVDGARVTIDGALGVGLFASDPATMVSLTDVEVSGTLPEACGDACPERAAGHGIASLFDASVALDRFHVTGSAWAGVLVSDDGTLDLANGVVEHNRVGRALLSMLTLARITSSVVYYDNATLEARDGVTVPPATIFE